MVNLSWIVKKMLYHCTLLNNPPQVVVGARPQHGINHKKQLVEIIVGAVHIVHVKSQLCVAS